MGFTTDQYNALTAAIAQGAKQVKYADKEVQYFDSVDQMLRLKRLMEIDLGIKRGGVNTKFAQFTKGLNSSNENDDLIV